MMDWEDVRVQLVDTPPITADYLEGYLSSLVRAADAALLLVDLGDDDGPFAAEAVLEQLAGVKTVLDGAGQEGDEPSIVHRKTLLVANKIDLPGRPTGWRWCANFSAPASRSTSFRWRPAPAWRSCARPSTKCSG